MTDASVSRDLIRKALKETDYSKVLPLGSFPHVSQVIMKQNLKSYVQECKEYEEAYWKDSDSCRCLCSMDSQISQKSDLVRLDAACGVAMIVREL